MTCTVREDCIHLWPYLAEFVLESDIFQSRREYQSTFCGQQPENLTAQKGIWKNILEPCWIPKATDTHSKYVTHGY